jgi:L-cystine uptake protein TcyP (sodium:dicarboxylate symporter family)
MKPNKFSYTIVVAPVITSLLFVFTARTFAQTVPTLTKRDVSTKAAMLKSNQDAWHQINQQCSTVNDACAQAAIEEASIECSVAAKFFKRDTKVWQVLGFALVIASAGFTGVGASATLANAKIFSTLGGTTGLGAVTSTVQSNVSSDQTGISSVNTTLSNLLTYVQKGGPNGAAPSDADIYRSAPIYAAQCAAAATGSSGTGAGK